MLVFKGTFGTYNCPKQFLSIPLGVAVTGWKRFHAALFRPCQADIAQSIMCSPCLAHNGLQALFGLAVITSGNRNKAYIKLTWSKAIRYPNGFLWSWHGSVWGFFLRAACSLLSYKKRVMWQTKTLFSKAFCSLVMLI